jgi:hypothetical protein
VVVKMTAPEVAEIIRRNLVVGIDQTARAIVAAMARIPAHTSIDPHDGEEPLWPEDADYCDCGEPAGSDGMCRECSYERFLEECADQRAER